jgi:hypothetical protein
MTDFALLPELASAAQTAQHYPSVKPRWLRFAATAGVVLAHVGVAVLLMHTAIQEVSPLDSVNMDLVPEGDYIDQEEVAETQETPPPEAVEEPDIALPPPLVMAPDPISLPIKNEEEKLKKAAEKKRQEQQQAHQAQQRRRSGAPDGRAQGSGHSQSVCLAQIAMAMRRHAPGSTGLGAGHAHVSFHVHSGGGISVVSASGSTPGHAAIARRVVSASRGPSICGSAYLSQSFSFH